MQYDFLDNEIASNKSDITFIDIDDIILSFTHEIDNYIESNYWIIYNVSRFKNRYNKNDIMFDIERTIV